MLFHPLDGLTFQVKHCALCTDCNIHNLDIVKYELKWNTCHCLFLLFRCGISGFGASQKIFNDTLFDGLSGPPNEKCRVTWQHAVGQVGLRASVNKRMLSFIERKFEK